MTDAGLETWFLRHEEVSHLLERHRQYPALEHVTMRGVEGARFYLFATKTVDDALNRRTVSELKQHLSVATLDLSPGEAPVKPTHVRTSFTILHREQASLPLSI